MSSLLNAQLIFSHNLGYFIEYKISKMLKPIQKKHNAVIVNNKVLFIAVLFKVCFTYVFHIKIVKSMY